MAGPTTTPTLPPATAAPGTGRLATSGQAAPLAQTPSAQVAATVTKPAPIPVELPSSDAQYLQNPRPRYPPISLRLREQGTVLLDVLVGDQGLALQTKVKVSSGYFRLDDAAASTVRTWRFVPGKRDGVSQSMWFTVPITFAIE
jgi:protein TonB